MNTFSVKAVVQRTGINAHTLRVWERRYALVEPQRSATGRREYSKADVEKLSLVAYLIAQGHTVSKVARLSIEELHAAVADVRRHGNDDALPLRTNDPIDVVDGQLLAEILTAVSLFQLREVEAQLTRARTQMGTRDLIFRIYSPLLREIGRMVAVGELSVAHEHALSAILKKHIYQLMLAARPVDGEEGAWPAGGVVIATQEGDHHEFGVLLAALLMAGRSVPAHFFGVNMPAEPLARAANAIKSRIVLIGKTFPGATRVAGRRMRLAEYLRDLDRTLHKDAEIWIGGRTDGEGLKGRPKRHVRHFDTLQDLDDALRLRSGERQ